MFERSDKTVVQRVRFSRRRKETSSIQNRNRLTAKINRKNPNNESWKNLTTKHVTYIVVIEKGVKVDLVESNGALKGVDQRPCRNKHVRPYGYPDVRN